jgi:hypothetical protein
MSRALFVLLSGVRRVRGGGHDRGCCGHLQKGDIWRGNEKDGTGQGGIPDLIRIHLRVEAMLRFDPSDFDIGRNTKWHFLTDTLQRT